MIDILKGMKQSSSEEGFTLIELLVVILIIGILAAIAIPAFMNQRKSAVDSATQSDVRNAATVIESDAVSKRGVGLVNTDTIRDGGFSGSQGTVLSAIGSHQNGYCIQGYNPGGNHDSTSPIAYDSTLGGMVTEDNVANSICPASVLTAPMANGATVEEGGSLGDTSASGSSSIVTDSGVTYQLSWQLATIQKVRWDGSTYPVEVWQFTASPSFDGQFFFGYWEGTPGNETQTSSVFDAINGYGEVGVATDENGNRLPVNVAGMIIDGKEYGGRV